MNKISISRELDPYFNIALEHELFLNAKQDIHLFLWQNDSSVIIGRNQNLYAECDLAYMEQQNIKPVRRFSGGGAVYHDKGNLNFTFITKLSEANEDEFLAMIKSAIAKLGIDCEFSGRNDLLCKGQKFSGHAYYTDDDNYMYHGTILINVDTDKLTKALTPSKLKLQSKGIASVKSRVVNLSDIDRRITVKKVIQAFIDTFPTESIEYIDKSSVAPPLAKTLSSNDWLYAQSPSFDIELQNASPIGNVTVYLSCTNGIIKSIKVNTDSLYPYDFKQCESGLIGKSFVEKTIWTCIEQYISSC